VMKGQEALDAITEALVRSLEEGAASGQWVKPWKASAGAARNALTGQPYQGGNLLWLWVVAADRGYGSAQWATYKQWSELGAQVRKGEKGTHCVKWVSGQCKDCKPQGKQQHCTKCPFFPSSFVVFNAGQVDGWTEPEMEVLNADERAAAIDAFFSAVGATVRHGGDRACYSPSSDTISMPLFEHFTDAASYYGTLAHEHIHWTGAKARLGRDFSGVFGSAEYAFEELVAELGAAMLCGVLGIEDTPRADHAQYLASWLGVLREKPSHLWKAASLASKAATYLTEKGGVVPVAAPVSV
jgi:antirestriction protein ArdC